MLNPCANLIRYIHNETQRHKKLENESTRSCQEIFPLLLHLSPPTSCSPSLFFFYSLTCFVSLDQSLLTSIKAFSVIRQEIQEALRSSPSLWCLDVKFPLISAIVLLLHEMSKTMQCKSRDEQ